MLLHLISIIVLLFPFGEILMGLIVLLKQSHALNVQLIGLTFDNDRDLLHLWVVKLACVSSI